jgi:hypothetical protein
MNEPDPAEHARILVAGHLPGLAHVPRWPVPLPVRHAADSIGQPLILVRYASAVAEALRPSGPAPDTPIALCVPDAPPNADGPNQGRAWISGWARPLAGPSARAAALEFADVRPIGDLLLLGQGFVLYRVEVVAIRLDRPGAGAGGDTVEVDPGQYAAAEPDPLHPFERDLLHHLTHHHRGELAALLRRLAPEASTCGAIVTPVRLDRHGMLVDLTDPTTRRDVPPRRIRVEFPARLRDPHDLIALLRTSAPQRQVSSPEQF